MNPELVPLMIFTIVVLAMAGGFLLLFPMTRRLGQFLEYRMSERGRIQEREEREVLLRAVEALRDDMARLAERQDFTERLLESRQKGELPGGESPRG